MAAAAEANQRQLIPYPLTNFPDFVVGRKYFIKETFLNEQGQPHVTEYKYEAKLVNSFSRSYFKYQKTYLLTLSVESIQNVGEVHIPSHNSNQVHINFQDGLGYGNDNDPNIIRLKNTDEFINEKTIFLPREGKTKKDIQNYIDGTYSFKVSTDDEKLIGIRKHPYLKDDKLILEDIPYQEYPYHVVTISSRVLERSVARQVVKQHLSGNYDGVLHSVNNYLRGGKKRSKSKKRKKQRKDANIQEDAKQENVINVEREKIKFKINNFFYN